MIIEILEKAKELIVKPDEATDEGYYDRCFNSLWEICNCIELSAVKLIEEYEGDDKFSYFKKVMYSTRIARKYLERSCDWYNDLEYKNGAWFSLEFLYGADGVKIFGTASEMQQARIDLIDKTIEAVNEELQSSL